jgi:hypothetical protein
MLSKTEIKAKDKEHLKGIIEKEIAQHGPTCSLNHIDVSDITDMSHLFQFSSFNGDISEWNTSSVKKMNSMFYESVLIATSANGIPQKL